MVPHTQQSTEIICLGNYHLVSFLRVQRRNWCGLLRRCSRRDQGCGQTRLGCTLHGEGGPTCRPERGPRQTPASSALHQCSTATPGSPHPHDVPWKTVAPRTPDGAFP